MSGETYLLAIVITIEPLPIVAFILTLSSERGTQKGLAFIVGWILCLIAIMAVAVDFANGHSRHHKSLLPAWATAVTALVVGIVAIAFAIHRRRNPKNASGDTPKWANKLDTMSLWAAAAIGVLVQPWALVAAGAGQIGAAGYGDAEQFLVLLLFAAISTATLIAMEVWALASPEVARHRLHALHGWINAHRQKVITWLLYLVGVWLIIQSTYSLLTSFD
jgi:hypothetical protein